MDYITIARTVTAELGLVQPTTMTGSLDLQTAQIAALINRCGDELKRDHQWTALQTLFTLDVTQPTVTTGNVINGSAIITGIPDTSGITAGIYVVSGSNLPAAARVLSVDSATQVTMDMVAT